MLKEPDVYIGTLVDEPWATDPTPDDDEYRGMPQEITQILGFNPEEYEQMSAQGGEAR